jgi:radical SAM protein with 4Fe4S-binding SPASM domain
LRLELARIYLDDPHLPTKLAGMPLLADEDSPEADYLLLKCVADPIAAVWEKARAVLLHRHPWLILEVAMPRPVPDFAQATPLGAAWANLREAIRRVVRENELRADGMDRLLHLPGVAADWVEEMRADDRRSWAEEIESLLNSQSAGKGRQFLMSPTYRCNLTCSYCYSRGFGSVMPMDMTPEDLAFVFSWAAAQGLNTVLLGGGEPTVYSHFARLLQLAKEHGISVRLTSNCMYSAGIREQIASPAILELVAHYDQEIIGSGAAAAALFEENLRTARENGLEIVLRYTLTERSNPEEWSAVMDLAQRLSVRQLNYAFAFQGSAGLNAHFNLRDGIGRDGGQMERVILGLCADAEERGLLLQLSKPFPLCALSSSALRRVLGTGGMRSACAVHRDDFTRNLTVNPDLSTFPCNGIAIRGPNLREVKDLAEAGRQNAISMEALMLRPYAEACRECALWYRGLCRGTCLAEHYRSAQGEAEFTAWQSQRENSRVPANPHGNEGR